MSAKKDLVITRVFDAPMKVVWNAWVDPELVMKWWGPDRFTCPSADIHFREGGTSLLCMRASKELGGQDYYSTWTYTKIVPMKRIEYIDNLTDKSSSNVEKRSKGQEQGERRGA